MSSQPLPPDGGHGDDGHQQLRAPIAEVPIDADAHMGDDDAGNGAATSPATKKSCRQAMTKFAVGQTIAFLVGCTGLFSQLLATNGVDVPTVQNALNYFCLSFALLVHAGRNGWRFRLTSPWWAYAIVAFCDLEANYMVTKAYQCTDITSIMLLDCMTIPTCFVLSRIFLKAKFQGIHYGGIALCVVGIALIIVSDTVFAQPGYFGDTSLLGAGNATVAAALNAGSGSTTTTEGGGAKVYDTYVSDDRWGPGVAGSGPAFSANNVTTNASSTTGPVPPDTPAFCLGSRLVGDALCLAGSVMYGVSNVAQVSECVVGGGDDVVAVIVVIVVVLSLIHI